jgi:hypothetical protein
MRVARPERDAKPPAEAISVAGEDSRSFDHRGIRATVVHRA